MKITHIWFQAIFGAIINLSVQAVAQQIVLESSTGENYVLEISSKESFLEVVDSIDQYLTTVESQQKSLEGNHAINSGFRMDFLVSEGGLLVKAAKKPVLIPRSYTPANLKEKNDIGHIVRTLANNSLIKIKAAEASLKKAGDRIDQVHPFQFLIVVFTDEELKVCMRNLQGRSWVWKKFLEGIIETLAEENGFNNLMPHLSDFTSRLKIDPNTILPSLEGGKWQKLIDILIDIVPRSGKNDRYGV